VSDQVGGVVSAAGSAADSGSVSVDPPALVSPSAAPPRCSGVSVSSVFHKCRDFWKTVGQKRNGPNVTLVRVERTNVTLGPNDIWDERRVGLGWVGLGELTLRTSPYPPPNAVEQLPDPAFPHLNEYLEMLGAQPDRRSVLLRGEVGGTVHTHRARTDRMLSVPTHGDAPSSL